MRRLSATCMALGLAGVFLTVAAGSARADRDNWHRGWHGHHEHWRGPPVYAVPRYYAPPPVYYAPPPRYYAPPPAYYAPPPVYYGAPSATFSFGIR
jgi:hypothetical protein